ncbi:hypothetical protein DIX60_06235 [Streptococcus iniae]|uniref:hypothetical protein n=1 Tax=Streptococcus iniae TaxID=1346 RepID=UPI0008D8DA49|nr:hypothetical protein [Streptococcus iniae]OHX28158.1 hypothetical protein BKX95_01915 [Streptococcus iniae]RLV27588.1 hypothetical protein DIX60_06235 [Streptococcus iniae]
MIIKRCTRFSYFGATITLLIGSNQKVVLKKGESINIPIQTSGEMVKLKRPFQTGKQVYDSDVLLLKDNLKSILFFWSAIALIMISHLVLPFDSDWLFWLTIIGLGLLLGSYLIPSLKWENEKEA